MPAIAQKDRTLAYYRDHAREFIESTARLDLDDLYKPFLKELQPGAHILDAGCGSGRDAKVFLDRGFHVTAIDASEDMARATSALTGQSCEVLAFQEMSFQEEFDGSWACASLLHVSKDEMPDVMQRFVSALKPGGIFYISLKEGEGERIAEDGRFFNYYTPESFRTMLHAFPMLREISFWKTEDKASRRHSAPWLNFLLRKS